MEPFLFILIAFFGGVVSVFSPCSGALLPIYFAFIFKSSENIFKYTLIFAFGVLVIALPTTIGISFVFNLFQAFGALVFKVIGVIFLSIAIMSLFGKNFILHSKFKFTNLHQQSIKKIFALGIFAGFSLGTCAGPILGVIVTLAATTQNLILTSTIMLFYILGIVLPLLLIALGFKKLLFFKQIFTKGKLFKITVFGKPMIFHSTNIIMFTLFIFLSWLFYFHQGSIGSLDIIKGSKLLDLAFDIQDKLVELLY